MTRYCLAELKLESPVSLPFYRSRRDDGPADVRLSVDEPAPVADERPKGEIWQEAEYSQNWRVYTTRTDRGLTVRLPGWCESKIALDGSTICTRIDSRVHPGMLEVYTAAGLWVPVLRLHGYAVLHASAVTCEGQTIAFFGPSGSGKSTLAAMLAASGGRVVADDFLPLMQAAGRSAVNVYPSGGQLRLRAGTRALNGWPEKTCLAVSADGRLLPAPTPPTPAHAELGLLVRPIFLAGAAIAVRRLSRSDALVSLLRGGVRTLGIRERTWLMNELDCFSRLAASVPCVELTLPSGPFSSCEVLHALQEISA